MNQKIRLRDPISTYCLIIYNNGRVIKHKIVFEKLCFENYSSRAMRNEMVFMTKIIESKDKYQFEI